jgi:uncharacterized phiE125 gp8 family phage protein
MDYIVFGTPQRPTPTITPFRSLVRISQPAVEPVSLAEAKVQARVDTEADDAYIQALIAVARQYVEDILDITLLTTVWETSYDLFPVWQIVLPRPMLQAANITVSYRLGDGLMSTKSSAAGDFRVDTRTVPGRIYPNWSDTWPGVRGDENSVVINYTAGFGDDGSSVPPVYKHLIMMLVAHWYDTRQIVAPGTYGTIPKTFDTLLAVADLGVFR